VDGWREERRLGADLLLADALEAVERHAAADVGEPARGVGDAAEGVQSAEALSEKRLVAVGQDEVPATAQAGDSDDAQGSEDLSGGDGITVFTVSDLATAIRVSFPADSQ